MKCLFPFLTKQKKKCSFIVTTKSFNISQKLRCHSTISQNKIILGFTTTQNNDNCEMLGDFFVFLDFLIKKKYKKKNISLYSIPFWCFINFPTQKYHYPAFPFSDFFLCFMNGWDKRFKKFFIHEAPGWYAQDN